MPKTLDGVKVPEEYWDTAKKQAREQGLTIKKDKDKFYQYSMGVLKKMMKNKLEEMVVAGDVAVPSPPVGGRGRRRTANRGKKWSQLVRDVIDK